MKHWGLFLFALAFAACHDDNQPEPAPDYYITPEEDKIEADCNGVKQRIAVSSNCDWHPGAVPEWCVVQKITAVGKEYLDVEVLSNTEETSRDTTIPLLYGRRIATATLTVTQSGKPYSDPLKWQTFLINNFPDASYELSENKVTRRYRITGREAFITPSFRKQIFPGNLINYRTDNRTLTSYLDKYTIKPIFLTVTGRVSSFKDMAQPSYTEFNEWIKEVIAKLPQQNFKFDSSDPPIRYTSYRHLHLLGRGNMGLSLDEMISGKSYLDKEMEKPTGLIYNYRTGLFKIIMDYPEIQANETIDRDELSETVYINDIFYGKTALLLIETNYDYDTAKATICKIRETSSLTDDELKIKKDLDVWYIYFDEYGAHTTRGDYTLIGRCEEEMATITTGIIPLTFSSYNPQSYTLAEMEVTFDLP